MALLTVERLLEEAQGGKKLNTADRRRVVAWLASTQPDVCNTDMAAWFKVSEGSIRKDKMAIKEAMVKDIREDDVAIIVADLLWDIRRQIRDLESSKEKTGLGTRERRQHIEAIVDTRLKATKALQDLGFLPKNLGNMTVDKFEYAAIVSVRDGSVNTTPMNLVDEPTQKLLKSRETQFGKDNIIDAEVINDHPEPTELLAANQAEPEKDSSCQ